MKKYYILIIGGLFALTSCKKWLDITPQSSIAAEELFKTEEGFQESLNGIYSRCAQTDLYGDELTCGFLDALAQNYTLPTELLDPRKYYHTSKYEYKDGDFISRKDNAWKGLYNAIVNDNLILENVDQKKDLFTGNNYAIIKGEALALRAYLHFDVLRMFGAIYSTGASKLNIPYVTSYSNKVTPFSTNEEVVNKILADLNAAKVLLAPADSIRNTAYVIGYPNVDPSTELDARSLFNQNRRHRLNYFAVCGELARVYLYKGDKANALANAEEIINSKKFTWTKTSDFISTDLKKKDRILYKELLFGWSITKSDSILTARFNSGAANSLYISSDARNVLYELNTVGGDDNRYKEWFSPISSTSYLLQKYLRNPNAKADDTTANLHPLMAPAIRLSEVYYIAAECSYDANPTKALQYVDEVRHNRGIQDNLVAATKEAFLTALVKEARKEWYGEGQIFYMYKRLNRSIISQIGSPVVGDNNTIFVLPLPNDEIEFGGR